MFVRTASAKFRGSEVQTIVVRVLVACFVGIAGQVAIGEIDLAVSRASEVGDTS